MTVFKLSNDFIDGYVEAVPPFGFRDVAGTSLGEIAYIRTYSNLKADGTKEKWYETCRRVIEGMYEIQRRYVKAHNLPWSHNKAVRSAEEAYDRMFKMKWLPPGRGIQMMGGSLVMSGNAAPLQNCAFVSTDSMSTNPGRPFGWAMEASMLGIGVGFDTEGSELDLIVHQPEPQYDELDTERVMVYTVPDTREGWAKSVELLINSYLKPSQDEVKFDYSQIRPYGSPIKTFGGVASGPAPLMVAHNRIRKVLDEMVGCEFDSTTIVDLFNIIGVAVVSGNVRRSAELAIGKIHDEDFLALKDFSGAAKDRSEWGWMSNNSVAVTCDDNLDAIVPGIIKNGEPGVIWMDTTRNYGRLADKPDGRDYRVKGYNPCVEQPLESYECCTLVSTFPTNCDDLEDYLRTLKFAYLYGKTVTLMNTPWPETNAVMIRNRRIGISMGGIADFIDENGQSELISWMDMGYWEIKELDRIYSEWFGIRESIKLTTVKPDGTVSLLAGVSPGAHWQPGTKAYYRIMQIQKDDPLVRAAQDAGYRVEVSAYTPESTVAVYFPMIRETERGEHDVPLLEKVKVAMLAQKWWSDNGVSCTFSYAEEEANQLGPVLDMARGNLKAASFLPLRSGVYAQMPYTAAETSEILEHQYHLFPVDTELLYANGTEAIGERGCSSDSCDLKAEMNYMEGDTK